MAQILTDLRGGICHLPGGMGSGAWLPVRWLGGQWRDLGFGVRSRGAFLGVSGTGDYWRRWLVWVLGDLHL